MKKPSLSFDQKKIQQFFIQHGEKFAFAAFVLVAAYFGYKALSVETFDRTPQELAQITQQARQNIERSQWRAELAGVEVYDYAAEAARISDPIEPPADWVAFHPPVFELKAKRTEPSYLAVEEIEVSAGFGAMRVRRENAPGRGRAGNDVAGSTPSSGPNNPQNDRPGRSNTSSNQLSTAPAARDDIKGYRWAVIKALVPWNKQRKAYEATFSRSVMPKPSQDQPEYVGYLVERAEVSGDTPLDQLQWQRVGAGRDDEHYAYPDDLEPGGGDTLVDSRYIIRPLAFPLPPLVGREWGSDVTHSEIPLADQTEETNPETEQEGEETANPQDLFNSARQPRRRRDEPSSVREKDPDVRLFRFFDMTVEPGKRYRYRVRLALLNPNRGIEPQYLDQPELAEGAYRLTEWSEPSPVVVIPRDNNLLIGPAIAASGRNEPKLNVMFEQFVEESGAIARHEGQVMRGQVANETFEDVKLNFPGSNIQQVLDEVTFTTDLLVVDFIGGDSLAQNRRVKRPAEVLLFAADGDLEVRTESADREAYENAAASLKEEQPANTTSGTRDEDDFGRRPRRGRGRNPFDE